MARSSILASLTATLLLALPTVALAHPAFNPSSIPTGQSVDAMLVVPHGCAPGGGMPDMAQDGVAAEATVELAVQQRAGVTLEPGDVDGWDVTDDGEAWVWSDAGGATTDVIELPVTITLGEDFAVGEQVHLKAFQECVDGSAFQWIGTPDEQAQWPAVLLEASAGDIGEAEADDSLQMDHGEMDMGDEAMGDDMATDDDMDDDMAMDGDDAAEAIDDMADDDTAMDGTPGDDGLPTGLLASLGLLVLAVVGGVAMRSRSAV